MDSVVPHPITVDRLREVFEYMPCGGLRRLVRTGNRSKVGDNVGFMGSHRYLQVGIDGRIELVHRVIWALNHGEWPKQGMQVDHINMNRTDNRIENLREATISENRCNTGARKNNKTGLKGVSYSKREGKFFAQIRRHGKQYNLGYFDDKHAAHAAYVEACTWLHGEFGRTT